MTKVVDSLLTEGQHHLHQRHHQSLTGQSLIRHFPNESNHFQDFVSGENLKCRFSTALQVLCHVAFFVSLVITLCLSKRNDQGDPNMDMSLTLEVSGPEEAVGGHQAKAVHALQGRLAWDYTAVPKINV